MSYVLSHLPEPQPEELTDEQREQILLMTLAVLNQSPQDFKSRPLRLQAHQALEQIRAKRQAEAREIQRNTDFERWRKGYPVPGMGPYDGPPPDEGPDASSSYALSDETMAELSAAMAADVQDPRLRARKKRSHTVPSPAVRDRAAAGAGQDDEEPDELPNRSLYEDLDKFLFKNGYLWVRTTGLTSKGTPYPKTVKATDADARRWAQLEQRAKAAEKRLARLRELDQVPENYRHPDEKK